MDTDNPFFDSSDTEHLVWSKQLPHWHQDGKYLFVTFRLADSLPQSKLDELREEKLKWSAVHPAPLSEEDEKEYHKRFSTVIDRWLDNNYGKCILREERIRTVVEKALHFYDNLHYELIAYVVMPNHVHLLVRMLEPHEIMATVFCIKNYTAKEINNTLGIKGKVWQSESFDRIIRNEDHLKRVIRYIIRNNSRLAYVK